MKVTKTMPQVYETNALILCSGKNSAHIYQINHGSIRLIDSITPTMLDLYTDIPPEDVPPPELKGHAKTIDHSSKIERQDRLIKLIDRQLSKYTDPNIKDVFIFCPQTIHNQLLNGLTVSNKTSLTVVRLGNFVNFHPLKLLKEIEATLTDRIPA